jgi:hypothetical protein
MNEQSSERLTVSVSEAARLLGTDRGTAYGCVRTGQIPSIKLAEESSSQTRALEVLLDRASGEQAA